MRRDTPDPHRSRTRALKILFDADVRGEHPRDRLATVDADPRALDLLDEVDVLDAVDAVDAGVEPPDGPREAAALRRARARPVRLDPFTRRLVGGVADELVGLDAVLGEHAIGWRVSRMPVIDRNVLRLAVWELAHEDVPVAVVLDEALELARAWSTERAVRFVNGVLAAVARLDGDELRARLAAAPPVDAASLDDHLLDPDDVAAVAELDVSRFADERVGASPGSGTAGSPGLVPTSSHDGADDVAFEDLLFAEDVGDDVLVPAAPAQDEAEADDVVVVPAPGAWLVRLDSSPLDGPRTGHWPSVLSRREASRLSLGAFTSEDREALEALPDGAWVVAYQAGVDPDERERPEDRLVGVARVRRPRPSGVDVALLADVRAADVTRVEPGGDDLLAAPSSAAAAVAPPEAVAAPRTPAPPSGAQTTPDGAYVVADPPVSVVGGAIVPGRDTEPVAADDTDAPSNDMVATRGARERGEARPGHAAPVAPPSTSDTQADDDPPTDGSVVVLEAVGSFLPYVALDDAPLELTALAAHGPAVRELDADDLRLLRTATDEAVTAGTRGPLGLRVRRFGDTTIGSAAPADDGAS